MSVLGVLILAASTVVGPLGNGDPVTTEAVTNVAFRAGVDELRAFVLSLELDATPSNCVEIAFGCDADGNGDLGSAECALSLGWDCGAWFVRDEMSGDELREIRDPGRRTMNWRLIVGGRGDAKTLQASDGDPLFASVSRHPPHSWFDRDWNLAKAKVRGLGASAERIVAAVRRQGLAIIVR